MGQIDVARVLLAALGRAHVTQERDLLFALHRELVRKDQEASKSRVSELAKHVEEEMNKQRSAEDGGAGEAGLSDEELQRMLVTLQEALRPSDEGVRKNTKLSTEEQQQREGEHQRRVARAQPQLWRQTQWTPSIAQLAPKFVSRWDQAHKSIREYASLFTADVHMHTADAHDQQVANGSASSCRGGCVCEGGLVGLEGLAARSEGAAGKEGSRARPFLQVLAGSDVSGIVEIDKGSEEEDDEEEQGLFKAMNEEAEADSEQCVQPSKDTCTPGEGGGRDVEVRGEREGGGEDSRVQEPGQAEQKLEKEETQVSWDGGTGDGEGQGQRGGGLVEEDVAERTGKGLTEGMLLEPEVFRPGGVFPSPCAVDRLRLFEHFAAASHA